ncbi:conserved hypothetical protein [Segniliparus rotundus DSM 44985]|uniref:Helix-turn-helix domain-containing protein n=1 Tax=Segniliparus rotundus (strain ATCC BAA-972 / CDC 1076 / CIP 108378 / DSM 44985 / JCM 13578) TaxID=640132 RepID=D6ZEZ0_SEGRD|nr:transcriptional regulator [Segniliparus rotundus]ADG97514.1 conserved hypothetical protein [Segniliparus rotundus DSM 44985]
MTGEQITPTPYRSDELLTTRQVSERFGIPMSTLRWARHANNPDFPPSFALSKRRIVYRLSSCIKWLEQREAATRKGGGAVA